MNHLVLKLSRLIRLHGTANLIAGSTSDLKVCLQVRGG